MSAILDLRNQHPSLKVLLVDSRAVFLRVTHLHKTVHTALGEWQIPYRELARRHSFSFMQAAVSISFSFIHEFEKTGELLINGESICARSLILATGFMPAHEAPAGAYSLSYLMANGFRSLFEETLRRKLGFCIVGAGPTGLQYLFEIDDELRSRNIEVPLSLVYLDETPLNEWPRAYVDYVEAKLRDRNISVYNLSSVKEICDTHVTVERQGVLHSIAPSSVLFLTGVSANPMSLECDAYGRVLDEGKSAFTKVFAAGDISTFQGKGLNAMTAQAGVRKGRLAAKNAVGFLEGTEQEKYKFRELGFFLSLGKYDALGFLFYKEVMLSGLSALGIKEAIEIQFDLFIKGIDTYPF